MTKRTRVRLQEGEEPPHKTFPLRSAPETQWLVGNAIPKGPSNLYTGGPSADIANPPGHPPQIPVRSVLMLALIRGPSQGRKTKRRRSAVGDRVSARSDRNREQGYQASSACGLWVGHSGPILTVLADRCPQIHRGETGLPHADHRLPSSLRWFSGDDD